MIQGFGTFVRADGEQRLGFRSGDSVVDLAPGGLDELCGLRRTPYLNGDETRAGIQGGLEVVERISAPVVEGHAALRVHHDEPCTISHRRRSHPGPLEGVA